MEDTTIDTSVPAPVEGEVGEELLEALQADFERVKKQKARESGGVEGTTLLSLCFLHDEQYTVYRNRQLTLEPQDANKPNLVFNLIAPRVAKLMGRLAAFNAPFKARPNKKDPQAIEEAEVVDRMIIALDEKLDQPSRMREILYWLLVGGTAFEHTPWVPNSTIELTPQFDELGNPLYRHIQSGDVVGEAEVNQALQSGATAPEEFEIYQEPQLTGDVGSEILSPFEVFLDNSVKSVLDLSPDQWVHIAKMRTIGWVKENFGVDVDAKTDISLISSRIVPEGGESVGGTYLKDLIPLVQGSCDENDPKMTLVVQSYQPASTAHPQGRYVCWIPDDRILHEAEIPYEANEIPLTDFHFTPVTTSFWTRSFVGPLISPQRFINKRMNQLAEQANAAVYSHILLGPGMKASDIPADQPGVVENGIGEGGNPNVARMPGPELPSWFLPSIELAVKMFNDQAGGMDLMEDNKFPGQLRGPMAVPMLQEIMDTQWGPLFTHLGERLARVKQQRLNRVKQFYPPARTIHYTDRTQKDEVMTFHTEQILRSGTAYNITVERGAILPELRALREARITERLRGPLMLLYTDERTGKIDKSKVAADLQFGDFSREGRESRYRKLQQEINKMLWEGKTDIPPVQPFYDHKTMLDEMEDEMSTTEFLKASPKIQALFGQRWQQHATFLQQEAQAQQQSMQQGMIHSAVAQATQQAAAKAAADAVDQAHEQVQAQRQQPTERFLAEAQARSGGQNPSQRPPAARSRKLTIEEKE